MALTLHYHPLSSFCMKALVGLYELEVGFEKHLVDLGDPAAREAFARIWPLAKFPVLRDGELTVPESTTVLEHLDRGRGRLVPADPARAIICRLRDRFFDLYVNATMGKIVTDKLVRPEGQRDALGVAEAKAQLVTAYGIADEWLREGPWAVGEQFTIADCAAAPALYYANRVIPFGEGHRHLAAYYARLAARPSFVRVLDEAAPYLAHWSY